MNGTPTPPLSVHANFIKEQLPTWLTEAPDAERQALRASLVRCNQSRHDLIGVMRRLSSPLRHGRALMINPLRRKFAGKLDHEQIILRRVWKHHHLLGLIKTHAGTTEHGLLEAALQNFEADEAEDGGMEDGSGLFQDGRALNGVTPEQFARFCRHLDIGKYYQAHLLQVLGPAWHHGRISTVQRHFNAHACNTFEVGLRIAHLKGEMAKPLYDTLLVLVRDGRHPDLRCSHLTLDGVALPNVLVIESGGQSILYVPEDPQMPFKVHPSLPELDTKLAERLEKDPTYVDFFKRLVPLRHRETLLQVKPAWIDWYSVGATGKRIPTCMQSPLTLTAIEGDVFNAITLSRIEQIKQDARIVAVPTEDADAVSRQKRLQAFIEFGESLAFFAASFVPIVGEALLAVSAVQLVGSIYSGFAAWSRGDSDEALNDLMDVVDSVAQAAVTAGVVKTVGFGAGLVKVKLRDGADRLWNPDLTPYRHLDSNLPGGLTPNAQGIYTHEQQHYVKLDDHLHAIERDAHSQQWHLQHPSDPDAFAAPLLTNGVGGWRQAHETPRDWDDLKLIKRLGPDAANITEPQVQSVLLLSGASSSTLRQAHQEVLRPPPLLRDTLKRFNLEQEIREFDPYRADGSTLTPCSPYIQLHLVCSLPEWPKNVTLTVVDEQGATLVSHGSGSREITITQTRFNKGELLHAVESQLPASEFNELLPTPLIEHLTKVENLAVRLTRQAPKQRAQLFAWLSQTLDAPTSTVEQVIGQILPELSKSHLEEMAAVLSPEQKRRLQREKSLTEQQHWEADQYVQQIRANRARESLHLDSVNTAETPVMMLSTLEQLPGWPRERRLEVRDKSPSGRLLCSIGAENAATRYLVTHEGEQFRPRNAAGLPLHDATDLLNAIRYTLSPTELHSVLRQSEAPTLKQAMRKTSLQLMARKLDASRAKLPRGSSVPARRLVDPLFAEPEPPEGMMLRADGIYQAPALPDGSRRYYALDNAKYYRVRPDSEGWRLVDARSHFRAYQPYLRKKAEAGWEIDDSLVSAVGGSDSGSGSGSESILSTSSSDEFESAQSSSDYESADDSPVVYTPEELSRMRSSKSYQDSQNYLRVFDRANNGRYPLRDVEGRAMRIKFIQTVSIARPSNTPYHKSLVLPFIQWQGFEKVAALYDNKLEVTRFTAAHQRSPEEASLIGQATVVTTRAIRKGETLGVYGGELLPVYVAENRRDPYLLDVYVHRRAMESRKGAPDARQISANLVLSGDNVLSRINTLFEYENGKPVRQAETGYNLEIAGFDVDTQQGDQPMVRLRLTALFASEDIEPGTEVRWNYGYDEHTVRMLFGEPE